MGVSENQRPKHKGNKNTGQEGETATSFREPKDSRTLHSVPS